MVVTEVPAPPKGKRAIVVTLRFHTDGVADQPEHILPAFCYESGFINIGSEDNEAHGIKGKKVRHFDHLEDLPREVLKALDESGVSVLRTTIRSK